MGVVRKRSIEDHGASFIVSLGTYDEKQLRAFKGAIEKRLKRKPIQLTDDERAFYREVLLWLKANVKPGLKVDKEVRSPSMKGFSEDLFMEAFQQVERVRERLGLESSVEVIWFYKLCVRCVTDFIQNHAHDILSRKLDKVIDKIKDVYEEAEEEHTQDLLAECLDELRRAKGFVFYRSGGGFDLGAILRGFSHLEEALDYAFPGYIRNGMLKVIVKSFRHTIHASSTKTIRTV